MIKFDNLIKQIKKSSNVFIMGHKNLDLDAIASCVAAYNLAERARKNAYIVIDETKYELSVKRAFDYFDGKIKLNIIKYSEAKPLINSNSLLIIVDTYIEKRIQNPKILKHISNKIIVDHHLFGKPISNRYYIDSSASSCSEMFGDYFHKKNFRINKYVANLLYSGIILDTNGFCIKTTALTHEVCVYLLKHGATTKISNNFIKSDLNDYIKIQRVIFDTEFYKKKYAIVFCGDNKCYEPEELAKISDSLIMFNNVEASFAIGSIDNETIGVSARSNSNVDVSIIMLKLEGGGSKSNAATQIKNKSAQDVINFIKGELK